MFDVLAVDYVQECILDLINGRLEERNELEFWLKNNLPDSCPASVVMAVGNTLVDLRKSIKVAAFSANWDLEHGRIPSEMIVNVREILSWCE